MYLSCRVWDRWNRTSGPFDIASNFNHYLNVALGMDYSGSVAVVPNDFGAAVFFPGFGVVQQINTSSSLDDKTSSSAAVSSDGRLIAVSFSPAAPAAFACAVNLYQKNGSQFELVATIASPNAPERFFDEFGHAIALSNSSLIVGAWQSGKNGSSFWPLGMGKTYSFPISLSGEAQGTLISVNNVTHVSGDLTIEPGFTLVFQAGAALVVNGTISIEPGSSVDVHVESSGVHQIVSASSVVGQFSQVLASSVHCSSVAVTDVVYSSSAISVMVDISSCGGFSTGAIVGVAVGSAIGAVVIVVLILLLARYIQNRSDAFTNSQIRKDELRNL